MHLTQIAERAKVQLAKATNLEPLIVSGGEQGRRRMAADGRDARTRPDTRGPGDRRRV